MNTLEEKTEVTPMQRVLAMISENPVSEVYLYRNGKSCIGCIKDGTLYYAAMPEVNLDELCRPVDVDALLNNKPKHL